MGGEGCVVTVTVRAASRLHFGLLNIPVLGQIAERAYGGLGLMIDRPGLIVSAAESCAWSFQGSLAERAKSFAERIGHPTPLAIVADGPPEHVGLGVGTALGMAVAAALTNLKGEMIPTANLAKLCGRGERSGIGVHGFLKGGLVVDHGKHAGQSLSMCQSVSLPNSWRVVLVQPRVTSNWHGEAERAAFARERSLEDTQRTTARLTALLDGDILSALERNDFPSFATAIGIFNRIAGEPFAGDQGGEYSNCVIEEWIDRLHCLGLYGVGQSSWGPTVFAFVETHDQAEWLVTRIRKDGTATEDLTIASAAGPAQISINC
jgi:beta-ribofuranosylaminobenzene 5'-phosphate synthase